jgi:hypothetical protein
MNYRYDVIVGNIGTVLSTGNLDEARATYKEYCDMSAAGYGRASCEPVTLMDNGEPIKEFTPPSFWKVQLRRAALLPIADLRRHASVSLNNRHTCKDCFCCACVEIIKRRENL